MQKTLHKEYENCRLRDTDLIYQDLCEWEMIDITEKQFCIVAKNQPTKELKRDFVTESIDNEQRQKFEDKLFG